MGEHDGRQELACLAGYQERVARLSEVLDSFEPRTLEIVARR
jgi:hypothetical protein